MVEPRLASQQPRVAPDEARNDRAAALRFAFACHAKSEGRLPGEGGPREVERRSDDFDPKSIIRPG